MSAGYFGSPKFSVPSRRYDLFIKELEKWTSQKQEEFKRLEKMELLYNICKRNLEYFDFSNDISFILDVNFITIRIPMLYEDKLEKFMPLIERISAELLEKELISEFVKFKFDQSSLIQKYVWTITSKRDFRRICLYLFLPNSGNCEYEVNRKYEMKVDKYTIETLTLIPRLNNLKTPRNDVDIKLDF